MQLTPFSICSPRLGLSVMAMHHYASEMEGAGEHRKWVACSSDSWPCFTLVAENQSPALAGARDGVAKPLVIRANNSWVSTCLLETPYQYLFIHSSSVTASPAKRVKWVLEPTVWFTSQTTRPAHWDDNLEFYIRITHISLDFRTLGGENWCKGACKLNGKGLGLSTMRVGFQVTFLT